MSSLSAPDSPTAYPFSGANLQLKPPCAESFIPVAAKGCTPSALPFRQGVKSFAAAREHPMKSTDKPEAIYLVKDRAQQHVQAVMRHVNDPVCRVKSTGPYSISKSSNSPSQTMFMSKSSTEPASSLPPSIAFSIVSSFSDRRSYILSSRDHASPLTT